MAQVQCAVCKKTDSSRKAKKVIDKGIEELRRMSSLERVTRIGAQMMLQVAIEEEVTAYLKRDYYERKGFLEDMVRRGMTEPMRWQDCRRFFSLLIGALRL
jgi:hypothetical protein